MSTELEEAFGHAMRDLYFRIGRETGYWAHRLRDMIRTRGGVEAARRAIAHTTAGFERLEKQGRLDLTVEVLALDARFRSLFSTEEWEVAQQRLDNARSKVDLRRK
jgi:hypothetical protein